MSDEQPPRRARGGELSGALADLGRLRTRLEHLEAAAARAEALDAVQGELRTVQDTVQDLARTVQDLAGTIQPDSDDPPDEDDEHGKRAPRPSPIWWPALSDEDYATLRPALREWLRDVIAVRYLRDARKLTPCWERHPLVVDLLTAAWTTWQADYPADDADAHSAADWQLRWRPELFAVAADDLKLCREGHDPSPAPLDPTEPGDLALLESFEPVIDRVNAP